MKTLILIAAALLFTLGIAGTVQAAQCADHAAVVAGLARNYGETVHAMGIASNGAMVEIFASDKGTWTIIQTTPAGVACLVGSGGNFESVIAAMPPQGVPG